jgi:multidrug efflux pump subunit AcrA (membrane-fusion protein)
MKHHSYIESAIEEQLPQTKLQSFRNIYQIHKKSSIKKWATGILLIVLLAMFLPWTQNIKAKGAVTTLRQEQRAQEINSIIAGKIVKWYVKEGDVVNAGDTILQLGEVKVDYFDPQLLNRTQQQIEAKQQSIEGYKGKATTADTQVGALEKASVLKLASLDNKIKQQQLKAESDSMDVIAANNDFAIYKRQIDAARIMLDSGAIALTEFEKRKANYQTAAAKKTSTENNFYKASKN